jgi:hypothetical protein
MAAAASTALFPRLASRRDARRVRASPFVAVARADASHTPKSVVSERISVVGVTSMTVSSMTALATSTPALASGGARIADVSLSDAWFGWYFAPGGVVLGPALFFTAFVVGQAVFEKLAGILGRKGGKK